MSIRDELLKIFENGRGEYFSGEELAAQLHVSRTAVWKAVRTLEGEGYQFDAVSGRGYSLSKTSDVISRNGIEKYLGKNAGQLDISVYKVVTSTNTVLKELAAEGAAEGKVIVASGQTAGRGRMARRFVSPSGTGLYLSGRGCRGCPHGGRGFRKKSGNQVGQRCLHGRQKDLRNTNRSVL